MPAHRSHRAGCASTQAAHQTPQTAIGAASARSPCTARSAAAKTPNEPVMPSAALRRHEQQPRTSPTARSVDCPATNRHPRCGAWRPPVCCTLASCHVRGRSEPTAPHTDRTLPHSLGSRTPRSRHQHHRLLLQYCCRSHPSPPATLRSPMQDTRAASLASSPRPRQGESAGIRAAAPAHPGSVAAHARQAACLLQS